MAKKRPLHRPEPAAIRITDGGARSGLGIRTKLAVWTSIPVLLLLGGSAVFLGTSYVNMFHKQARHRAAGYLQTLAVPVSRAMSVHALDRLDGYLDEAAYRSASEMSLVSLAALDDNCHPVARSKPGSIAMSKSARPGTDTESELPNAEFRRRACAILFPHWSRHRINGKLVLDISMPAVSGLRWGTLVARFDLTGLDEQLNTVLWVFVGLTLLLTGTMALALRLALSRLVVEPIDELAYSADQITRGHLDQRAWVASTDEIGQLAMDFNKMADELQSYTVSLERKVEERSAEIQRKNHELEKLNSKLENANEELAKIATTDALTGVANRRSFDEALDREFKRAARRKLPFSVVLADVDHFKNYNDTNGHPAGDRALQLLATTLDNELRATDVLARYGGEEFVVLLLDTPKDGAVRVAESLRAAVAAAEFEHGDSQPSGRVTASLGVATFPDDAAGSSDLVMCADKALYLAKAAGRNRVMPWGKDAAEAEAKLAQAAQHAGRSAK